MGDTQNDTPQIHEIVWEEPTNARGGRRAPEHHVRIVETLKSKPGEWARVATGATNDGLATTIRRSSGVSFRDGVYEARSQRVGEREYNIFARYIGERE